MKILLADDHRLLLDGLKNLLRAHGMQVAGMAKDGLEAISLARELRPDVILMDIRMPVCDGLTATRIIKSEMPETKIIILTTSTEDDDLFEAVKAGACGYLIKSMDADDLVEAIKQAQQGIPPFSPGFAVKILGEFSRMGGQYKETSFAETPPQIEVVPSDRLSGRQMEVLTLVGQGLSYKEAGARLKLSPNTIKYHLTEIIQKLHLQNRAQVIAYAAGLGLKGGKTVN